MLNSLPIMIEKIVFHTANQHWNYKKSDIITIYDAFLFLFNIFQCYNLTTSILSILLVLVEKCV